MTARCPGRGLARLAALFLIICAPPVSAATPEEVAREIEGMDGPVSGPVVPPTASSTSPRMIPAGGALLIPESTNDRVMAFDPTSGDLLNADFIPTDSANLSTPIQAIPSASDGSILVSDQINDVVQEYDLDGNYIGVFAPAGGVDTSILDNIRGIALRPNGNLLVTVGGGTNASAVAEFDTNGNFLGNFVANGSSGLNSPFDVSEITVSGGSLTTGEWLVGGINSDAIHRYDSSGAPQANLAPMDTFPEQIFQIPSGPNAGNVLVGNFTGTQEGVVELDASGTVVGIYNPAGLGGYRGAYELPNGNILTTNGDGVHEIDRAGNLVESKITGVSARFITFVPADSQPPTITTNTGITLNEGATEVIDSSELQADDPDTFNDTLQFVVTAGPVNGQLELTTNPGTPITSFTQAQVNANEVAYVHDDSETTSDSFTFDVQDGSGNNLTGQTFGITINAVADGVPAITANTGITLNEGATEAIDSSELQADDPDTANDSLQFVVTAGPVNGQLELTTNPGTPITSFTQAQVNANEVVYVHDGSDTTSDSFTFDVQDGDGNNLTGQTFDITINAVDDGAPVMTANTGITVDQGATATIGSSELQATDADTNDGNLVFAVTSGPSHGQLELTTNPGSPITSFTQTQINANQVVYVHDNSFTNPDSFDFEVQDGSGNNLTGQTFAIAVNLEARNVPGLSGFAALLLVLLLAWAGILSFQPQRR